MLICVIKRGHNLVWLMEFILWDMQLCKQCLHWMDYQQQMTKLHFATKCIIHTCIYTHVIKLRRACTDYIDIAYFFLLVLVTSAWIKTTSGHTFLLQWIKHTIFFQVLWDVHIDQDFVHLLKWKTKDILTCI